MSWSGPVTAATCLLELGLGLPRERYDEFIVDLVKRELESEPIDLFFASARQNELGADAVASIKALGIPTVLAVWDNILVAHRVKKIASAFDICWVHEPEALKTYESYGARIFHDSVAANPFRYEPTNSPEDVDISFVGQRYGVREWYIEQLFEMGIPAELYDVGWVSSAAGGNPGGQQARPDLMSSVRHTLASVTHANGRSWLRACAGAPPQALEDQSRSPTTHESALPPSAAIPGYGGRVVAQ
jgi:hypothetical protein